MAASTQKQQARALYLAGHSLKEIAEKLNVSPATVRSWKARECWGNPQAALQQKMQRVATRKMPNVAADTAMVRDVLENESLTDKERVFCLHYSRTFNGTAACVKAGYSPQRAAQTAYELLRVPRIRDELLRLKELRCAALMGDVSDVVEKYWQIAFADLSDFVEWGRVEVDVMGAFGPVPYTDPDTGETGTLKQVVNDVRFVESETVDGTLVSEVKIGKAGASVKLADRMRALEWLGKYFEAHPADVHRREYDNRRLELEVLRTQAAIPDTETTEIPDDGFLAALSAQGNTLWPDEFAGDEPSAPAPRAEAADDTHGEVQP